MSYVKKNRFKESERFFRSLYRIICFNERDYAGITFDINDNAIRLRSAAISLQARS